MSFARLLPDLAAGNHAKWAEGKDLRFHERVLPHPRPLQLLLTCPKPACGAIKDCARRLLHFKTAFKPVMCSTCNSSPSSAKWCCPCGHLWHHCPQHRAPGFAAGSGKRSSRAGVRRAAPKPLGHTQDPRVGVAMRAGIAAADLQASWDSASLLGTVAALAAAQDPGGDRNDVCHPPPRRRKALKTSYLLVKSSGSMHPRCKDSPVEVQPGATLLHAPLCVPSKGTAPSCALGSDDACSIFIRPGWVPGGEQPGSHHRDTLSEGCGQTPLPSGMCPPPFLAAVPPLGIDGDSSTLAMLDVLALGCSAPVSPTAAIHAGILTSTLPVPLTAGPVSSTGAAAPSSPNDDRT